MFAVDFGKEPPDDRLADRFRLNRPRQLGLRRGQLLEAVVVMARQPEEAGDPFPIVVRVELTVSNVAAGKRRLKNGLKNRLRTIRLMLDETIITETPPR